MRPAEDDRVLERLLAQYTRPIDYTENLEDLLSSPSFGNLYVIRLFSTYLSDELVTMSQVCRLWQYFSYLIVFDKAMKFLVRHVKSIYVLCLIY